MLCIQETVLPSGGSNGHVVPTIKGRYQGLEQNNRNLVELFNSSSDFG
jgi:hypothetical protein